MTLYVLDGRYIQDHFPGIGRYAHNLAGALARVAPSDRFRILYDSSQQNSRYEMETLSGLPNVEIASCRIPTLSLREQLLGREKPLFAGAALFHALSYTKPVVLPIPSVTTFYDATPFVFPDEVPSAIKRVICRISYTLACRSTQRIIAISEATRADLHRIFGVPLEKMTVIPLAADGRFVPASKRDVDKVREKLALPEIYVLYFGSNKPKKNLVKLLHSWARLRTDATLMVAGEWDTRFQEARSIAASMEPSIKICFLGDVDESDVPGLMAGARAFVFPSLHEGFGLPPLEAMACGVPVLCSSCSSLPEVVGDAALLFDPTSVESIADALTHILEDASLREALSARGLARSRLFSWERTARETLAVYAATRA
jgi:glycosyltransferase involved in cell wall biosynthesis